MRKSAAGVGFEPTGRLHAQRFSRPPDSTALAPRRGAECKAGSVSPWASSSRSSAAPPSPARSGCRRSRGGSWPRARRATTSSASSPRWAAPPTTSSSWPTRSRRPRTRASSTCCSRSASGSRARSPRWRSTTSATPRSRSQAPRQASSPTPSTRARRCSRSGRDGSTTRSQQGAIVLVAGFQGVSTAHEVTTLGRGGSDATAVALAAALEADACEIYTDVEGVFTADPRLVPAGAQARRPLVRGDARAGRIRGEGADAALGRVRTQPRSPHPCPLLASRANEGRGSSVRRS